MRAAAGDRLHFRARTVGQHDRVAVVLEVRGPDGAPPYLVRHDNGHEAIVFPGTDAWVEHPSAPAGSQGE
jgi:hypothetical protein